MKELRELCLELDLQNPRTVLASGNLVFEAQKLGCVDLSERLRSAILTQFKADIDLVILESQDFQQILAADPISPEGKQRDWLTVMFFSSPPTTEQWEKALEKHQGPEIVETGSRAAYIYYTDGIGRSKLNLGSAINQSGTVRNRNTLEKVVALLG